MEYRVGVASTGLIYHRGDLFSNEPLIDFLGSKREIGVIARRVLRKGLELGLNIQARSILNQEKNIDLSASRVVVLLTGDDFEALNIIDRFAPETAIYIINSRLHTRKSTAEVALSKGAKSVSYLYFAPRDDWFSKESRPAEVYELVNGRLDLVASTSAFLSPYSKSSK